MFKKISLLISSLMLFFVTSCGTMLKPDQINRSHSNSLDVSIVLLDSIGLIFFLIPGIIAFAVDHANGTLYLPKGKLTLTDTSTDGIYHALLDNGYNLTKEQVENAVSQAEKL